MPAPPDELRFPAPPTGGPTAGSSSIIEFLGAAAAWRVAVSRHLASGEHALTARASARLAAELAEAGGFPSAALAHIRTPRRSLLAVTTWRAGFHDYLSDVWDVIGAPELELDECNALLAYLRPVGPARCGLCLEHFPPEQMHVTKHACPMFGHVASTWLERAKAAGQAPPDATSLDELFEPD